MEFRELIQQSLTSAFETLVEMTPHSGPPDAEEVSNAAMIGFAGDHLRGMLGIAVSGTTLSEVATRLGAPDIPGGPEDALGELANLLLGHVTRAWANHSIEVMMGTPLVISGAPMDIRSPRETRQFQIVGRDGSQQCVAWLDARVSQDLEVSDHIPPSDTVTVGDMLLF